MTHACLRNVRKSFLESWTRLVLVLGITGWAGSTSEAGCFDYGQSTQITGIIRVEMTSDPFALAVSGDRLYLAGLLRTLRGGWGSGRQHFFGFRVIDANVPSRIVGELQLVSCSEKWNDGVAEAGIGEFPLEGTSRRRPFDPTRREEAEDSAGSGSGFCPVAWSACGASVAGFAVRGAYAYVGVNGRFRFPPWFSFQVLDLSDPYLPRLVSRIETAGEATDVALAGDYAYALTRCGIQMFDVREPSRPEVVTKVAVRGERIVIANEHAYVLGPPLGGPSDPGGVLSVVDLARHPSRPHEVQELSLPGAGEDLVAVGDFLYVVGSFGLSVVDVSSPASPRIAASLDLPGGNHASGIAFREPYVLVANGEAGVHLFDVSNPARPLLVGPLPRARLRSREVAFGENVVGVLEDVPYAESGELLVYDFVGLDFPPVTGSLDIRVGPMAVTANRVCAGDGRVLRLIDTSDRKNPTLTGSLTLPEPIRGLACAGDAVYVTVDGGLLIVDIADPWVPEVSSELEFPGGATVVDVDGRFACVSTNSRRDVAVVDVSDPWNPVLKGDVSTSGPIYDLVVVGDYVYASGDDYASGSSLTTIDLTDPPLPLIVSQISVGSSTRIAVVGQTAYLSTQSPTPTLLVVDVTDPADPIFRGEVGIPGVATDVAVEGGFAYLAGQTGMQVVDVTNPSSPRLVGGNASTGFSRIEFDGGHVFVAGDRLEILPAQCGATHPHHPVPLQNPGRAPLGFGAPNPFRVTTTLEFALPRAGRVSVAVYDVSGRRVRELVRGVFPSGILEAKWDGRDEAGERVAPGAYFVRLDSERATRTSKVVYLGGE